MFWYRQCSLVGRVMDFWSTKIIRSHPWILTWFINKMKLSLLQESWGKRLKTYSWRDVVYSWSNSELVFQISGYPVQMPNKNMDTFETFVKVDLVQTEAYGTWHPLDQAALRSKTKYWQLDLADSYPIWQLKQPLV
jgi:hypothetical protein